MAMSSRLKKRVNPIEENKKWTCDFKDCDEFVQCYRRWKGDLFKLCTKHEAYMARHHYGRSVKESELDRDDIAYLWEKEEEKQKEKEREKEGLGE